MNGLKIGGKALIMGDRYPENNGQIVTVLGFVYKDDTINVNGEYLVVDNDMALIDKDVIRKLFGILGERIIRAPYEGITCLIPLWEEDEDQKVEEEAEA